MSRVVKLGRHRRAGLYCGERWYVVRTWYRYYGLFRRVDATTFSLGPVLFWRERAESGAV